MKPIKNQISIAEWFGDLTGLNGSRSDFIKLVDGLPVTSHNELIGALGGLNNTMFKYTPDGVREFRQSAGKIILLVPSRVAPPKPPLAAV